MELLSTHSMVALAMLRCRASDSLAIQMLMHIVCCAMCMLLLETSASWGQSGNKPPLLAYRRGEEANTRQPPQNAIHFDQALLPASHIESSGQHHEPVKDETGRRLLRAPESKSTKPQSPANNDMDRRNLPRDISKIAFPTMEALKTAGTGLGIVLGLFLMSAWLLKRGAPRPTSPLPKEVVSVLGRSQLASRQFVQLVRVGNKLVLVALTPDGATPITEVTEPVEVDRLLGLCMRNHTHSTTAEFQQVLKQLSRETG